LDEQSKLYFDTGDKKASEKTSQAMRDYLSQHRDALAGSGGFQEEISEKAYFGFSVQILEALFSSGDVPTWDGVGGQERGYIDRDGDGNGMPMHAMPSTKPETMGSIPAQRPTMEVMSSTPSLLTMGGVSACHDEKNNEATTALRKGNGGALDNFLSMKRQDKRKGAAGTRGQREHSVAPISSAEYISNKEVSTRTFDSLLSDKTSYSSRSINSSRLSLILSAGPADDTYSIRSLLTAEVERIIEDAKVDLRSIEMMDTTENFNEDKAENMSFSDKSLMVESMIGSTVSKLSLSTVGDAEKREGVVLEQSVSGDAAMNDSLRMLDLETATHFSSLGKLRENSGECEMIDSAGARAVSYSPSNSFESSGSIGGVSKRNSLERSYGSIDLFDEERTRSM